MAGTMTTPSRARRWASRHLSILCFVGLLALTCAWAVATPLFAAPDEPAHVIKAVATAHGEFTGSPSPGRAAAWIDFRIPTTVADAAAHGTCFAFHPDVSAACQPTFTSHGGTSTASTYVGRYPPLYYLIVGLPSLVMHSPGVLYAMRLVSALLSSIFLGLAFASAAACRHGRAIAVGVALAVTPMVIFLDAVVNPSGLEIATALCFWTTALVLFTDPEHPSRRALIVRTAVAAGVFMQIRGLSPLLLAIAGVSVAIVAGWSAVVALLRRRDIRIALGVLAVIGVGTLAWIFGYKALSLAPVGYPVAKSSSDFDILRASVHRVLDELGDNVGIFGWKDTPIPLWSTALWAALVIGALLAGIAVRHRRSHLVLPLLVAVVVLVPAVLSALNARQNGLIGQARYFMPVAVGVPVIACWAVAPLLRSRRFPALCRALPALVWLIAAATALVQLVSFVEALRRYRGGVDSPLLRRASEWAPPGGTLPVLALFGVGLVVYTLCWCGFARPLPWADGPIDTSPGRRGSGGPAGTDRYISGDAVHQVDR